MARFTITPDNWYACEFIGDEFVDGTDGFSPIKVYSIKPLGGGKRQFVLRFYHAFYQEGVRDKEYTMETLERGERFLLARSLEHQPSRILKFTRLELDRQLLEDGWRQARRHLVSGLEGLRQDIDEYPTRFKGAYLSLEGKGVDIHPFLGRVHDVLKVSQALLETFMNLFEANAQQSHGTEESFIVYSSIYADLREGILRFHTVFDELADPLVRLGNTERTETLAKTTHRLREGLESVWSSLNTAVLKMKSFQLIAELESDQ
jgi:hypothetical protein